jgi:cytochrome c oxidase cbb3-type subunit I/II
VPYENGYEDVANEELDKQANAIAATLKADGIEVAPETEIIALIAYLQRLGKDIKTEKTAVAK